MNPTVRIGQVWKSKDTRDGDRKMEVMSFSPRYAYMKNLASGRRTRIHLDRLRRSLGDRGYELVENDSHSSH